MRTTTELKNLYTTLTKNATTTNQTFGLSLISDEHRSVLNKEDWYFLQKTGTETTVADTVAYSLPYDADKIKNVTVLNGSTLYTPTEAPSRAFWDELNFTDYSSDIPEYWYQYAGNIELFPKPSAGGSTINYHYKRNVVDLNIEDYTTGTITTATQGDKTITGSGTTWSQSMVGRAFVIDDGDNGGDGIQYIIASVTSTTELELERAYGGFDIAAGTSTYVIGQVPALPVGHEVIPVYKAASMYWDKEDDPSRASRFYDMYVEKVADLKKEHLNVSSNPVMDNGSYKDIINPNLTITST